MRVLIIDGHPDEGRLVSHLLDRYQAALDDHHSVDRISVRDLAFDPNLRRGYAVVQPLEPDLERVRAAIAACDHLVVAFPMWWGGEPALLKGLIDPGSAAGVRLPLSSRRPVLGPASSGALGRRHHHDGYALLVSPLGVR